MVDLREDHTVQEQNATQESADSPVAADEAGQENQGGEDEEQDFTPVLSKNAKGGKVGMQLGKVDHPTTTIEDQDDLLSVER